MLKAGEFFNCTPNYLLGLPDFKNDQHYKEWVGSIDTLAIGLSLLSQRKRKELVTALNWLLQDNLAVHQLTGDKDYLIDKFIGVILPFTHLLQAFTQTLQTKYDNTCINNEDIFNYYQNTEKEKENISKTVNVAVGELLQFLFMHDEKDAFPNISSNPP